MNDILLISCMSLLLFEQIIAPAATARRISRRVRWGRRSCWGRRTVQKSSRAEFCFSSKSTNATYDRQINGWDVCHSIRALPRPESETGKINMSWRDLSQKAICDANDSIMENLMGTNVFFSGEACKTQWSFWEHYSHPRTWAPSRPTPLPQHRLPANLTEELHEWLWRCGNFSILIFYFVKI